MRLRFVEPDLRRPFQMPLNVRLGHGKVPLLSVIGALGIGAVFTQLLFQNIQGSGLDQYQQPGKQVILYPPEYRDGELMAPFAK